MISSEQRILCQKGPGLQLSTEFFATRQRIERYEGVEQLGQGTRVLKERMLLAQEEAVDTRHSDSLGIHSVVFCICSSLKGMVSSFLD